MPFDSNGVFTRVMNWTSDQQNGIAIECGRHDQEDDNFAEGFNDTFCRDGRAAATGNFNLGAHKIQNLADGTASTDAVNKGQLDTKANNNAVVHLTGNENISGSKTFTGTLGIPSDNLITKQDNAMEGGQINFEKPTNSSLTGNANIDIYGNRMRFLGRNSSNNYTTPLYLDLETNIAYATASDAVNTVVTTTGISKSENGFVKLGNGIIIQWGWHSGSGSTLTFPTPFTSTNYSVTANYRKQSSSGSGIGHVNFYPTSTTSCYFNSQGGDFQWIAIGY